MTRSIFSSCLLLFVVTVPAQAIDSAAVPELFVTADRCIACHNAMISPAGEDVSIGSDWRASMMANAARDPYWQAAVRREVLEHPTAKVAIENECSACHMPMKRFHTKVSGGQQEVFAHLPVIQKTDPGSLLAIDGVSCSMCHQIQEQGFGEKQSFTAGFTVDTTTPMGSRSAYGPFEIDSGRKRLMQSASLFQPVQSAHIQTSEHCATCHTLFTHALNDDGEAIGELPEQVPYLEWKHSAYNGTKSCQSCHMPIVEGEMAITGVLGLPRKDVSRHAFRGGNFFMPKVLNAHRVELGVASSPQELEKTSRRTAEHLESASARLSFKSVDLVDRILSANIEVENRAGHKLPSAYPSRRVWIHLTVRDGSDDLLFESGKFSANGSIIGNDNDADPTRFEPHYQDISSSDQVQIYEPILGGPDGAITTVLLTAVRYLKDNRLLPDGFDKTTADEDIAVKGKAHGDADFSGGQDQLRYSIEIGSAEGPFTIEAELWYQPIGYRWAQNLLQKDAGEIKRFVSYYDSMAERSALVLARSSTIVK